MNNSILPRVLVIDDLFGRTVSGQRNENRAEICSALSLVDCTGDGPAPPQIRDPIAEAVFHRGQLPACAVTGDTVQNDLAGILRTVRQGARSAIWSEPWPCWSLILLDLCFYTGRVTEVSGEENPGMAEGRPGEDTPSGYFGLKILEALREEIPDIPVVILSSMDRDPVARAYTRHGGMGFLNRTAKSSPGELQRMLDLHGLTPDHESGIIGHSLELLRALSQARLAASDLRNVLIMGEPGTGKEPFAKYLNRRGNRSGKRKLVTHDAGTLSPELYASALFGHVKGAFTGAAGAKVGEIVEADGGDLFLDEIGNMPPEVQRGLLRVLQESEVRPLGGKSTDIQKVNVRVLAATNANLHEEMVEGAFRSDLYERLAQHPLVLPPLRARKGDIELLAQHYLTKALKQNPNLRKRQIDPDAMALLRNHDWPGNVRELENVIGRAVARFPDVDYLQPLHLAFEKEQPKRSVTVPAAVPVTGTRRVGASAVAASLDALISALKGVDFVGMSRTDWSGRIDELREACARLMAAHLTAGLLATRIPTANNPEGEIRLLTALKLLTGDPGLKQWQAYDIVKKICQLSPACKSDSLCDPVLGPVFKTAVEQRRKKGGVSAPSSGSSSDNGAV
jgi:DNA-binding NtrC family response regulator